VTSENPLRRAAREGIVERSIRILRSHGMSDSDIRKLVRKDFGVEEQVLDKMLSRHDARR